MAVCLFLGLFYTEILKGKISRKVLIISIVVIELFAVANTLFIHGLSKYPYLTASSVMIAFLFASIVFFYKTMLEAQIKNLWEEPLVWINLAILIYYSGGLLFSLLFNIVLEQYSGFSKVMVYSFNVLNLLFYMLTTIGFYKAGKQKKLKPKL